MEVLLTHLVYPTVKDHTKLCGPYRISKANAAENPEYIEDSVYKLIKLYLMY